MNDAPTRGGLRGFLDAGGLGRLLALLVVYFPIYLGAGWVGSKISPGNATGDLLDNAGHVFFQVTFALIVGGVVLSALTWYTGWNKEIYGRQTVYRSWWMWLGPVVAAIPILLRILGIDWGGPALSVVLLVLASGLMIGYVEELLYRGIAVKMLRDGGYRELGVAALSSLLFGLSHGVNLLSGQELKTVAPTVLYTFAFGVMMYLTMRSFRYLVAAMILHGLTDPTTILSTGGIDKLSDNLAESGVSPVLMAAGGVTFFLLIPLGFILLLCVRGKANEDADSPAAPDTVGAS